MGRAKIGPGPGKYLLPPLVGYQGHDASRFRNPQYSMGLKLSHDKRNLGPGPRYNTENMTTYGKAQPPAYSLRSRGQDLKSFQGPGPAAYGIQDVPRMKEPRPPAYSVSGRHEFKQAFQTPGPNIYDMPSTLGPKVPDKQAAGAFSMSSRYPLLSKEQSPGPAKYDPTRPETYKSRLPIYSMSNRHKSLTKISMPGPSAYHPKLPGKGGFSFGLKTDASPYITPQDDMPCVNK